MRFGEMALGVLREPVADTSVLAITPYSLLPLSAPIGAGSDWALRAWPNWSLPNVAGSLESLGFIEPDFALFDGPLHAGLHPLLRPRTSVLRMFDRFSHMVGVTPALLRAAADLARKTDLVAYSAMTLRRDAEAIAPGRTLHAPNGVALDHFLAEAAPPPEYSAMPGPRAVYVGQTGRLLDVRAIALAAQAHPLVQFIIIGPTSAAIRDLAAARDNVHPLGPIAWSRLPPYLHHADVGLIPFDVQTYPDYVAAINPLKLFEYHAAGLPCLATPWAELAMQANPDLHLADREAFPEALGRILKLPRDPARCRSFAQRANWRDRVAAILAHLPLADASGG